MLTNPQRDLVAAEIEDGEPGGFCARAERPVSTGRRVLHAAPAAVGLILLVGAFFVIQREVRHLSLADIRIALRGIPDRALLAGAACTVLSYFVLSFYDYLGCIHVGARKSWRRAAFAAFCSYVLSHNLGCAAISGAAVRFRLYRTWRVAPGAIAQIIAFCSTTYLFGAAALIGWVLLFQPEHIPLFGALPRSLLWLCGAACWAVVAAYVILSFRRREFAWRRLRIEIPRPPIAIAQVVVASADMSATALIAYVLLPAGTPLSFGAFLAIYLASYTAGLLASVPGGLGVFDSAMLLALGSYMTTPQVLGVVLVFRLFYYVIPLLMAGLMFAGHELFLRGEAVLARRLGTVPPPVVARRERQLIRESEADFSVGVATGVVSATGLLLVFYTIVVPPPLDHRLLGSFVPQGANLLLCFAGVTLLGLAIGLSQRVTLAWKASLGVLALSILLVEMRAAPQGVPLALMLVMFLIVPFRSCYYRRARLLVEPLCPSMIASLTLWILSLASLGLFAMRRHMGVAWWHSLIFDAHTSVARWALGISALLALAAVVQMMRRGRIPIRVWDSESESWYGRLDHALDEIGPRRPSGLLVDESGKSGIPFLRTGRFIIGLGDPAGAQHACVAAIWRLRDLALQEGRHPAFIRVGQALLDVYYDIGLTVLPHVGLLGGTLCCLPQDIPAVQAALASEWRRSGRVGRGQSGRQAEGCASGLYR
ncbi:lysylphosphatidylglycerol synthase domain-containing protein [Acidomonas methanolica]|uniref:lysylphosphatidylglycerol synthase domain-containing protein n=1 Tax=Acidomonas methanolica TaxID=437 RepID=UPI00211A399D|nr:lysylphosphatidylglycerol synthase domain-containing protein [Acidomonas methanolica]MCQ9154761.1 lysylphosphatidylglycerol synthetase family protein [Acidomonas methanolica]